MADTKHVTCQFKCEWGHFTFTEHHQHVNYIIQSIFTWKWNSSLGFKVTKTDYVLKLLCCHQYNLPDDHDDNPPFKYYIRLQEKSMFLKLMVAMSLFSIGFGFVLFYLNTQYGFIVLNIATVVVFIAGYALIARKIKQSRHAVQRASDISQEGVNCHSNINDQSGFKKHHLVPVLIIGSYIMFYMVPSFFVQILVENSSSLLPLLLTKLLIVFSMICDPLIYIFMKKEIRKVIFKRIFSCWSSFETKFLSNIVSKYAYQRLEWFLRHF